MTPRHPKRTYSRDFTPHGKGKSLTLKRVPAGLFNAAHLKAKREGISLRWLLLTHLTTWIKADSIAPDSGAAASGERETDTNQPDGE